MKYTDKHPEVRRTKQLIEQLEERGGTEKSSGSARSTSAGAGSARYTEGTEVGRLQLQAAEYDANIKQLRAELATLPAEITKYKRWIEATPIREAEWNGLTRDYTELRRNYDELVARSLQAISSETLERKQKGSKFKIIDPARLPDKPFKPNFLKVFFAAVGAGLGLGFILTVLLDFIDTSFKDTGEIEAYVGLPVICTVSLIEKEAETHKRKTLFVLSVVFFSVYGVALLAALGFLWKKGLIII